MQKKTFRQPTLLYLLLVSFLFLLACQEEQQPIYPEKILRLDPAKAAELAQKIRKEVAVKVIDGMDLSLWASDSLVTDPIAISMDTDGGIYYTNAVRLEHSEFDIRGFREWMTASISWQSVEDRRQFLRTTFDPKNSEANEKKLEDLNGDGSHDWHDLTVEKEAVWKVSDESGNGYADKAQMYIEDFHEEITDLGNGVESSDGEVFIAVGPDLWKTKDTDNDGIADTKESISHGYAVHIGFGAHGMSGVTIGPDGRVWWGIGDIGMNVVDKEGKHWKYPNQGVIVRCERDGSNFEVFAAGLRNTHEFVFDKYGNLISEDNDGDHSGERERLVYITEGSDSGWRSNWQYGKYTDPDNNLYKVWMDEKLHIPRWDGQAAYITPPIVNYVNGPTGLVYNPGTALGEQWKEHFFIAEFRGSPANSPIHAFTLKPSGASFELDKTMEVVSGVLPTGLDFGPDGALYFGDWIDGWGVKNEGRIWKLDVPNGANSALRQQTKALIQGDFTAKKATELGPVLKHPDMRVRLKAQFELAKRGLTGFKTLLAAAQQTDNQLARIHGLWGIGQIARKDKDYAKHLTPFLKDADSEIVAQAVKLIGDVKYAPAAAALLPLLKNESLRVQFFAAEALGRIEYEAGIQPILDMLLANNDKDAWLRHAGILALSRIGKKEPLLALANHPSKAMRITGVVALRRMKEADIAIFLKDEDEYIATEAARAINDDWSIEAALPALAATLKERRFTGEPIIRRAINANLRLGKAENIKMVSDYAKRKDAPENLRAEALATLSTWANPSPLDRVDGRYRGVITGRNVATIQPIVVPIINDLLTDNKSVVQVAATKAAAKLGLKEATPTLFGLLQKSSSTEVRSTALQALSTLEATELDKAMELALADKDNKVRAVALDLIPVSSLSEAKAVTLLQSILEKGTFEEQQVAISSLGTFTGTAAISTLTSQLQKMMDGKLPAAIQLDVLEAIEKQKNPALLQQVEAYHAAKPTTDALARFRETLVGGNIKKGQNLFYRHEGAQCMRCHTIFEWGGDAGPVLSGVGARLTPEQLLESLIEPSAEYATGYEVATVELKNGETTAGIVMEETADQLTLKIGKEANQVIDKKEIASRETVPSSMPGIKDILTKREIRDLVAFLSSVKEDS